MGNATCSMLNARCEMGDGNAKRETGDGDENGSRVKVEMSREVGGWEDGQTRRDETGQRLSGGHYGLRERVFGWARTSSREGRSKGEWRRGMGNGE